MTSILPATTPRRSVGLKLLLVCALALLMSIPAAIVWALIYDRTSRAEGVVAEISNLVGGPGEFIGPIIAVPYEIPAQPAQTSEAARERIVGNYIIFPKTATAEGVVDTDVRRRGLFKAPVWMADLTMNSSFDLTGAEAKAPRGAVLDWSRAELLVGAADARGAKENTLVAAGQALTLQPASRLDAVQYDTTYLGPRGREARPARMQFFGAAAGSLVQPGAKFDAQAVLKFSGAGRIAFLAWGEETRVKLSGDWPGPSYDGGFPTSSHTDKAPAGTEGPWFSADWSVPYTARGVAGTGTAGVLNQLGSTSMGATFVETANPYQAVSRSLKYAPIFLGLVFFAYFVFETTQKKRIHPAQYVLIGLAQLVFYLLLLSIAERVGFDLGFLVAASATVGLISLYAAWAFESTRQGVVGLVSFSALYGLIYVLMRLQDWALLVGALTSFVAIAAIMFFTRKVDWYGEGTVQGGPNP